MTLFTRSLQPTSPCAAAPNPAWAPWLQSMRSARRIPRACGVGSRRLSTSSVKATIHKIHPSRCVAVLLLAIGFAACVAPKEPPKPAPRAFDAFPSEQRQVYDALFHYMFAHWERNPFKVPERFFLTVGGFDAPDDLLARFTEQGYVVAPGYLYRHGRGILCSAEEIRFASPTRATVYGGYLFGEVGGEWGPFVLAKRQGKWIVTSWKPDLFS